MAFKTTKFRVEYQRKSQVSVYKGTKTAPVHTTTVEALNNDEAKKIATSVPGRVNVLVFPPPVRKRGGQKKRKNTLSVKVTPPAGYTPPFLKTQGADGDATKANKSRRRKTTKAYGIDPESESELQVAAKTITSAPALTRADKAALVIEEDMVNNEAYIGSDDELTGAAARPTQFIRSTILVTPIAPVQANPVQCCPLDDDFDGNCQLHLSPGVLRNPVGPAGRISDQEVDSIFGHLLDENEHEDEFEFRQDDELDQLEAGASLKKQFIVAVAIAAVAVISSCHYLHTMTQRVEGAVLVCLALTCIIVALFPSKRR